MQFTNKKIPTVMTPEIRQKKGPNWQAEPVLASQKIVGAEKFVSHFRQYY